MPGIFLDVVRRERVRSVVLGASWAGYDGEGMQIERDGKRLSLANQDGKDAFYANLEDYVRLLQDQGANVYLVLGVPVHLTRFNPSAMVARGLTSF